MNTPPPSTGWNVDTLREHFELRLNDVLRERESRLTEIRSHADQADAALKEYVLGMLEGHARQDEQRFMSASVAVSKSEAAAEKRFEAVNEFRMQLSDQTAKFMPRAEMEARIGALVDALSVVSGRVERSEGQGKGMHAAWGYVVAGVSVLILLASFLMSISTRSNSNGDLLQRIEELELEHRHETQIKGQSK